MPTLAEVQKQIAAYGHAYIFWTQKEIRSLPQLLDEHETIKAVTSGMMNNRTWLAVCTDRRIFFVNCNLLFGMEVVQMPLDKVQSIDHFFTLFFGTIRVFDGINVIAISMVQKASILPFIKASQAAMYATAHPSPVRTGEHATDVATQLTELAQLKEKGYITNAEFLEQKKKILGH